MLKSITVAFKDLLVHLFGDLFAERGDDGILKLSLGRLAFWAAFVPALVIWIQGAGIWTEAQHPIREISDNHLNILYALLVYNLTKKAPSVISVVKSKPTTVTPEEPKLPVRNLENVA